ncbi:ribonuclease D [Breznakiella homolactica]|uniref:Ribonuclease D n=1 Tax=Breznakiella homolactica TaxID=2798577 RepID=A0A7T7XJW0_9SPIR|nr:ribonuclease D [Breznakiella homolactica]QQO07754.1 ribonuclease D [Breznakiella homolactica]
MEKNTRDGFTLINTDAALARFLGYLRTEGITEIAMDFEGEFNLHVYGEKLCLIQVFDKKNCFIIDPLSVSDGEIRRFLETKIIKYMYGAESDISLVYKQYGIKLSRVYDQQLLAETLNYEKKGLDAVLERGLGIVSQGKKKFQMYNWTLRPVKPEAMAYALQDVLHLFDLNTVLTEEIIKTGRYNDLIRRLVEFSFDFDKKRVPGIFKQRNYLDLPKDQQRTLQKIFDIREDLAREHNLPPNAVLDKNELFLLAKDPQRIRQVRFGKRVTERMRKVLTEKILAL